MISTAAERKSRHRQNSSQRPSWRRRVLGVRRWRRFLASVAAFMLVGVALPLLGVIGASAAVDPCGASGNPVACENTKPGTPSSQWSVPGSGSTNIQGFTSDISTNHGGTVHFKVSTAATSYRVDIY